jgi:predicted DNA-binding ribbon-helix-helix protein
LKLSGHLKGDERTLRNDNKTAHDSSMMKKRSITIHGHRTSVSLEEPFWTVLHAIAAQRGLSLASLVQMIDKERDGGLSSALRLFVLAELTQNTAGHETNIRPPGH